MSPNRKFLYLYLMLCRCTSLFHTWFWCFMKIPGFNLCIFIAYSIHNATVPIAILLHAVLSLFGLTVVSLWLTTSSVKQSVRIAEEDIIVVDAKRSQNNERMLFGSVFTIGLKGCSDKSQLLRCVLSSIICECCL